MKRATVLVLVLTLAACTDSEPRDPLDSRDTFHTPIGGRCVADPDTWPFFCAHADGYCYRSVCRPACDGDDKLTCGPGTYRVEVVPGSSWPCACVPG